MMIGELFLASVCLFSLFNSGICANGEINSGKSEKAPLPSSLASEQGATLQGMIKCKVGPNLALCLLLLLLGSARAQDERSVERADSLAGAEKRADDKMLSLLDWKAFVALVRQKIFLARVLEVFVTGAKYRFYQLSFYTSINKFSDLTNEERGQLLSGELGAPAHEPADEEAARQRLLQWLSSQSEARDSRARRKRHLSEPAQEGRQLSVADLILVRQAAPEPNVRIKWRVEPANPHYEPPPPNAARPAPAESDAPAVRDIPSEQLKAITEAYGGLSPASVLKSAFDSSINWWTREKEDKGVERSNTVVLRDWRASGCVGPARDQGFCASCYAISSMAFVEWAFCQSQAGTLTPLSVQYMVSCGLQFRDETNGQVRLEGCKHGMSRQTMDFVKEYGVELEANMPYYERETVCPVAPNTPRKKKGYIRPNVRPTLRLAATTKQLDLALKAGPVVVSMREPKDFLAYGGGLVEECHPSGGHAMLVVGNMIEDGVEYLLIKNSFGRYWGYDGFFKFRRSSTKDCVKEFIVPMISFPGRKAQARRIKAYLAERQTSDEANDHDDDDGLDVDEDLDEQLS